MDALLAAATRPAPVVPVGRLSAGFAFVIVEAVAGSPAAARPLLRLEHGAWVPRGPGDMKPDDIFRVHDMGDETFVAAGTAARLGRGWNLPVEVIPPGL